MYAIRSYYEPQGVEQRRVQVVGDAPYLADGAAQARRGLRQGFEAAGLSLV